MKIMLWRRVAWHKILHNLSNAKSATLKLALNRILTSILNRSTKICQNERVSEIFLWIKLDWMMQVKLQIKLKRKQHLIVRKKPQHFSTKCTPKKGPQPVILQLARARSLSVKSANTNQLTFKTWSIMPNQFIWSWKTLHAATVSKHFWKKRNFRNMKQHIKASLVALIVCNILLNPGMSVLHLLWVKTATFLIALCVHSQHFPWMLQQVMQNFYIQIKWATSATNAM